MNLTLTRKEYRPDGIFSVLTDEAGNVLAHTLEHAYPKQGGEGYVPKVDLGTYHCVRGQHQLAGAASPFSTFEIKDVPGHSGVLFHKGNWQADSHGCVLLGEGVTGSPQGQMVTQSGAAFRAFMDKLTGLDEFTLTVKAAA